jgi:hypothetical protein
MEMATTFKLFADKMGGSNTADYIGKPGEIFYDPTTTSLRISDGSTPGGLSILSGGSGGSEVSGCFHKTANVTAAASDTVYAFDWYTDTTAHITDGVTVTSAQPTRVVLSSTGNYEAFIEMQVRSTGNAERDVFLWLAKNGNDIAQTAVKIQIRGGGLSNPVYQLLTKKWLLDDITANDYIELRFALSDYDRISLEYTAAQTSPYPRPAVPSAVLTITQLGS